VADVAPSRGDPVVGALHLENRLGSTALPLLPLTLSVSVLVRVGAEGGR